MSQSQSVKNNLKERTEADEGSLKAYEVALEKAIEEVRNGQRQLHEVKQLALRWEKRVQDALRVVDTLMNVLPADRRAVFLERTRPFRPPTAATRGGETYENRRPFHKKKTSLLDGI
jgi:hypothetical protein